MIIKQEYPPIYERAKEIFDIDDRFTIYTYGEFLYNPAGITITNDLVAHESIHMEQQKAIGGADIWWDKYFIDEDFRFSQEAEAYHAQYAYYCMIQKDRNKQAKYLWKIAQYLSGPTYKVGITHGDALKIIRDNKLSRV